MKSAAIIAAGGRGLRMKTAVNKQFIEIENKPIIAHTLEIFEKCAEIECIIPVVPEDWLLYLAENIVDKYGFSKIENIVCGGKNRQESVFAGLIALPPDITHVAIHDAVRPFVNEDLLKKVLRVGAQTGAAILAVPVKDTLKQISNGIVEKTLDRSSAWLIQTPQVFERKAILAAYHNAIDHGKIATDDSALLEAMGGKVHVVESTSSNIKITTPEDLLYAYYMMKQKTIEK